MRVLYLHGFVSSPAGGKASYFSERFSQEGIDFRAPDLNGPDFSKSTAETMIRQTQMEMAGADSVALVGSSMGGFIALRVAALNPSVKKLILLAPAFEMGTRMEREMGQAADLWKQRGSHSFFHYATGREENLHYAFLQSLQAEEAKPLRDLPVLILHGIRDTVVPWELSFRYLSTNPHAELVLLDSDHQLTDKKDVLYRHIKSFLL